MFFSSDWAKVVALAEDYLRCGFLCANHVFFFMFFFLERLG